MRFTKESIVYLENVPQETKIYYDKDLVVINLIFLGICFIIGLYLIFVTTQLALAISVVVISFGFFVFLYRFYANRKPQLIINNEGIKTGKTAFYKWNEIKNCEVSVVFPDKKYHLRYDHPNGQVKFDFGRLTVEVDQLQALINTYRAQSKNI